MSTTVNSTSTTSTQGAAEGTGGRLVTADGRTLPLEGARLRADAAAGVARVVLEQRFRNAFEEPLRVTYLFPLPADGAVSGYAFTIGDRRVVGEVDKKKAARERFERALAEGRTAGIVEQERSSLFTQELGNVPPGAEVVCELVIDQRLRWLDEGAWEWRFPTAAGPRYTGAPGRVADAARTEIAVADAPLPVRLQLSLSVRDAIPGGRKPESPVVQLAARERASGWEVELSDDAGMRLDRDVVVRWPVAAPKVGVRLECGRPDAGRAAAGSAYALMTLVPPAPGSAEARPRPRDLILLLDTSGSMGGEPLQQLKRVCAAMIDSLGEQDKLELIEFSTAARRWNAQPVAANEKQRAKAKKWLEGLQAGGGTEMVAGVLEALAPLSPEAQRQVVLLTDGYIGFETEVAKAVATRLPAGSRLHVVGVGSAVNRSLTGPAARAGRGVEVIIAPGEDPERAVKRLLARTASPIVTDVTVSGSALRRVAPERLPDLYAGAPALAALELDPAGGTLEVRGRTAFGVWEQRVEVVACEAGQGSRVAATLFARERVEDLEQRRAIGDRAKTIDAEIEQLGLDFQIATRLTTWVAVSQEITVDPSAPTRREIVPQELPHGVSAEGVGLRAAVSTATLAGALPAAMPMQAQAMSMPAPGGAPPPAPMAPRKSAAGPFAALGRAAGAAKDAIGGVLGKLTTRDDDEGGGAADELDAEAPGEAELESFEEQAESTRERVKAKKREQAPARPAEPAAASPKPVAPPRRLRARIVLSASGELILEITADGELDWSPDATAAIRFAGGATVSATVDAARTTRAARLGAGQVVRLALRHAGQGGAQPQLVTLRIGGQLCDVEVAAV